MGTNCSLLMAMRATALWNSRIFARRRILFFSAHSSHLLQPLDVACFGPLKRRYGDAVLALARNCTNHIRKERFLPVFETALLQSFTTENIQAGFRGAGLVPHDLQAVILKLDVVLQTPAQSPQREGT